MIKLTTEEPRCNPGEGMEINQNTSEQSLKRENTNTNDSGEVLNKKAKRTIKPKHNRGIGRPLVCGMGDVGQLGFDSVGITNPALIPFFEQDNLRVQEIIAGGMHTLVLTSDGNVYSFGCNDEGALGRVTDNEEEWVIPTEVNVPGHIVQISAGDSHSAALTNEGIVYIWGQFRDGSGPMGISINVMGAQLAPLILPGTLPTRIMKIASGANHLVMLGENGIVYTCGSGQYGQLGRLNNTEDPNNNNPVPQNEREFWLTPQPMTIRPEVIFNDIFCGTFSTYCKSAADGIFVCGLNNHNQLGIQRPSNEINDSRVMTLTESPGFMGTQWIEIAAGEHQCIALSAEGRVYSLGREDDGRLGLGGGLDIDISGIDEIHEESSENEESEESDAMSDGSDVSSEGSDSDDSDEGSEEASEDDVIDVNGGISIPTLIPGLADQICVHVGCGSTGSSYAVTANGRLFSWGFGENGQLCSGLDEDRYIPTLCEGSDDLSLENITIIHVSGGGQHVAMIGNIPDQEIIPEV